MPQEKLRWTREDWAHSADRLRAVEETLRENAEVCVKGVAAKMFYAGHKRAAAVAMLCEAMAKGGRRRRHVFSPGRPPASPL